jgi:type I restriction enzyme M protein
MTDYHHLSNLIWQIADLLRGPYRPPQYERVMLPMTVLRRFDCLLAPTKQKVLAEYEKEKSRLKEDALDSYLNEVAGQRFHNRSPYDFATLKSEPGKIDKHLMSYIEGFSQNVREIFERFNFTLEIEKMHQAHILHLIISKFANLDLSPDLVDPIEMGLLFEDLIRRANVAANETAGDHFTPREVIRLMVKLLFAPDEEKLRAPQKEYQLLDPVCGTGGMLSEALKHLHQINPTSKLSVFGQDFNPRSYAIALYNINFIKNNVGEIRFGDSLINDRFPNGDAVTNGKFDYLLANPPFGVNWTKQQRQIEQEHKELLFNGRFGAGLPRLSDSSLLFLQHTISKFEPFQPETRHEGSRLAIVFNGSPLFTGGASSDESKIRRWIIENDWLEAIIALPEQLFYKTGIGTYIWIVTNRKQPQRQGKVQLIDARERWQAMRRSLGSKRRYLGEDDIAAVVSEYKNFVESTTSKIFDNADFGYHRVPIERPLRLLYQMTLERKSHFLDAFPHLLDDVQAIDRELGRTPRINWSEFDHFMLHLLEQRGTRSDWRKQERQLFRNLFTERDSQAEPVILKERQASGNPNARVWGWFPVPKTSIERMYEPDSKLRDYENIKLKDDMERYFRSEVEPHLPDSWANRQRIRRAYEINFNRYFYQERPPRPLAEIDADIKRMEAKIIRLLREVTA